MSESGFLGKLVGWAAGLGLASSALGQGSPNVPVPTMLGFKAPIHENNRLVAVVSGREARPSLLAGEVRITDFRLDTYRYRPDREPLLVVESPAGVFGARGARSDQSIELRSADGRFTIRGTGWTWERATGLLTISNRVHASLKDLGRRTDPVGTNAPSGWIAGSPTNRPTVEIDSGSFEYSLRTGEARFRGNCVAEQAGRARLRAVELHSRLNAETERPNSITATNLVQIELLRPGHEGNASGSSALYTLGERGEQIDIAGPATWQFGPGQGSADQLRLLPAKEAYSARGHARLRLLRPASAGGSGEAEKTPARAGTSSLGELRKSVPMDIACEAIDATEGEVVFHGPVTATQAGVMDFEARGVTALLAPEPGTGRRSVSRLIATNEVRARVVLGTNAVSFEGQRMAYSVEGMEIIDITGGPKWSALGSTGSADRFLIHPDEGSFEALDQVRVRWVSSDPAHTNVPPVELSSDRLKVDRERAELSGHVQAHRDRWDLKSGALELLLATNAVVREIVATKDVELDYLMPPLRAPANSAAAGQFVSLFADQTGEVSRWKVRAPRVKATLAEKSTEFSRLEAEGGVAIRNVALQGDGGRLVFDAQDGMLRLTDNARLHSPDGVDIVGEPATTLGLDPNTGRFVIDGPVRRMALPAPKGNARLPGPIPAATTRVTNASSSTTPAKTNDAVKPAPTTSPASTKRPKRR